MGGGAYIWRKAYKLIEKQFLFSENDIIKKAALDVMKKEMLKPNEFTEYFLDLICTLWAQSSIKVILTVT